MKSAFLSMLREYRKNNNRYHMPGHKGKVKINGKKYKDDITELCFSDNLLCPQNAIKDLEERLALAYNSSYSKISTCGATIAIYSVLKCFEGKKILIERNSHSSIYNAIRLFGISAKYIDDAVYKYGHTVSRQTVEDALKKDSFAAVVVTCPNYLGNMCDLGEIKKIANQHGAKLIVDASHGANIFYCGDNNKNSIICDSDAFVISFHKLGLGLTQSAGIFANESFLYNEICRNFNLLHTTSPSYLIMASIDFYIDFMLKYNHRVNVKLKKNVSILKERLKKLGVCVSSSQDWCKVVVDFSRFMSGFEAYKRLENNNVFAEMADENNVVFFITIADRKKSVMMIEKHIMKILKNMSAKGNDSFLNVNSKICDIPEKVQELYYKPMCVKTVNLCKADGMVLASDIVMYPPSVPIVLSGERLNKNIINILSNIICESKLLGINNENIEVQDDGKVYNV